MHHQDTSINRPHLFYHYGAHKVVGLGLPPIEMDGWTRFEHPGWNEGYHSLMCGYLGTGQGVAWMANGENGKLLGQEVMRGLARAHGWPGFEPRVRAVVQADPAITARCVGRYQYSDEPDWGAAVVQDGDRLLWQDSPGGLSYELYPSSETVFFTLEHPDEIIFIAGAGEEITAVSFGEHLRLERVG